MSTLLKDGIVSFLTWLADIPSTVHLIAGFYNDYDIIFLQC